MESWIGIAVGLATINVIVWVYLGSPFWPDPERRKAARRGHTKLRKLPKPEHSAALHSALSTGTDGPPVGAQVTR